MDRPANGGLALVVQEGLREVLDDADKQLEVGEGVDLGGLVGWGCGGAEGHSCSCIEGTNHVKPHPCFTIYPDDGYHKGCRAAGDYHQHRVRDFLPRVLCVAPDIELR